MAHSVCCLITVYQQTGIKLITRTIFFLVSFLSFFFVCFYFSCVVFLFVYFIFVLFLVNFLVFISLSTYWAYHVSAVWKLCLLQSSKCITIVTLPYLQSLYSCRANLSHPEKRWTKVFFPYSFKLSFNRSLLTVALSFPKL